jgi:hypothetical protein
MYNPALAPYVDHYEGNRRVWDYIEGEQAGVLVTCRVEHCNRCGTVMRYNSDLHGFVYSDSMSKHYQRLYTWRVPVSFRGGEQGA